MHHCKNYYNLLSGCFNTLTHLLHKYTSYCDKCGTIAITLTLDMKAGSCNSAKDTRNHILCHLSLYIVLNLGAVSKLSSP